jgi:L-fuculose-phosphate aldolase
LIKWQEERESVLKTSLKLVEKGLVTGKSGNVSRRLKPEDGTALVAITPTSRYYDSVSVNDISIIDFQGNLIDGRFAPSSETAMHLAIYRNRKDVNAIIHTHSLYASTVSVTGIEIPALLEEEVMMLGGAIKVARYAPSGTSELADNVVAALEERHAVILSNHGALAVGRTLRDAFDSCELLEKAAAVFVLSTITGRVNTLPEEGLKSALSIYSRNSKPPS